MLHILLLILKIIGILILVLLGLIILLLAILVFTPLRWSLSLHGTGDPDDLEGEATLHWLFHLISGEAELKKGKFTWRLRAAWKQFGEQPGGKSPPPVQNRKTRSQRTGTAKKPALSGGTKQKPTPAPEQKATVRQETTDKQSRASEHKAPVRQETTDKQSSAPEQKVSARQQTGQKQSGKQDGSDEGKKNWFILKLEKIKYTFEKICDKIKELDNKKERVTDFLTDEIHRMAFSRLIREVRRFFRLMKPDRMEAEVVFGFQDPAYTGYLLAYLSMIYPMIGEYTDIRPDFEHRVFHGQISAQGKIRLLYVLIFAWNMLWDKSVRTTFGHIRSFRF